MKAGWKQHLFITVAVSALASPALADNAGSFFENWSIDAYNTARTDFYEIDGNTAASPYPNDGWQSYDEFSLNAARQFSAYERLNFNIFGVINDSDYRNVDNGIVPERIQLMYENGEAAVPFRMHLGDYFAGISYRTLQRSLKGASLELQPFSSQQQQHSFLFFGGTNLPTYRSFDADDDAYGGFSWLVEDREWGRASVNVVHAYQDETTPTLSGMDNSQMLYSAAVETPFDFADQNLILEGELSLFEGDYATVNDKNDIGAFAQLSGRSKSNPLDYRLRYERYGTDYRPNGAIIIPDRQSYEAHAGWRFDTGAYLRGRAQRYEDSFDSTNEVQTNLTGINLSGPVLNDWITGLTTNIDVYRQSVDDDFNTIQRETDALNASFNMPLDDRWSGQLTAFWQDADDELVSNLDTRIKQVGFGLYKPIEIGSLSGTVNPGIVLRHVDLNSGADSNEVHPTINLTLSDDEHRIQANWGILSQNRLTLGSPDIATQTAGLEYAYMMDDHELGVNASYYDRNVESALGTDVWRAGVYWTMRYNQAAAQYAPQQTAGLASAGNLAAEQLDLPGLNLLVALQPGDKLSRANQMIAEKGIQGATKRSGVEIYEATLIEELVERQRLVVEHAKGKVEKAGLVIDLTDNSSARSVERLYERVKYLLVKQFGSPSRVGEEGDFRTSVVDDINGERVIRLVEWKTANGTLRFGIPRRLDGITRMEIQHAKRFASHRNTLWSMDLY